MSEIIPVTKPLYLHQRFTRIRPEDVTVAESQILRLVRPEEEQRPEAYAHDLPVSILDHLPHSSVLKLLLGSAESGPSARVEMPYDNVEGVFIEPIERREVGYFVGSTDPYSIGLAKISMDLSSAVPGTPSPFHPSIPGI